MLHFGEARLVHNRGVDPLELGLVEMRRRAAECCKIETIDQCSNFPDRLDRLRGVRI